jgi:Fumarylacetoacetate (FAA) hydrolase family
MRLARYQQNGSEGLAAADNGGLLHGFLAGPEAMTLAPGDVIVTSTPSGVGLARTSPLWMQPGDVREVEVESIGILRNPIAEEPR